MLNKNENSKEEKKISKNKQTNQKKESNNKKNPSNPQKTQSNSIKPSKFDKKTDLRKRISNSNFPFSAIGIITTNFGASTYQGTGTLIYPMIVLTSAQTIYNKNTKKTATNILFSPCKNKKDAKFGIFKVIKVYFDKEAYPEDKNEDYAILLLEKRDGEFSAGFHTGFFGLKIWKRISSQNDFFSIYGYPGKKGYGDKCEMWGMEIEVTEKNFVKGDGVGKYSIYASLGQGGAAVVLRRAGQFYVVGIHVGRGTEGFGIFITEKRLGNIKKWIREAISEHQDLFKDEIENFLKVDISEGDFDLSKSISIDKMKEFKNDSKNDFAKLIADDNIIKNNEKTKVENSRTLELYDNKIEEIEVCSENFEIINLDNKIKGEDELKKIKKINSDKMEVLRLSNSNIGINGINNLSTLNLHNLERLDLSKNKIGLKGIILFSDIKFYKLEELDLSQNLIKDEGMEYLSKMELNNLERLYLNNNDIGVKGIEHLSKMKLGILERLDLNDNKIGDEGIKLLTRLKLENLYILDVINNKISKEGIEYFLERYPQAQIYDK